jgi:hypothetical protein
MKAICQAIKSDLLLTHYGSLVIVTPMGPNGRAWLQEHTSAEPWQWYAGGLAVEPRYLGDLLAGLEADHLTYDWQ